MDQQKREKQVCSAELDIAQGAVLVMFGSKTCGVCRVIWPQLLAELESRWPELQLIYVDCGSDPQACAQNSVFSLPVIKLFFDGRQYLERIQVFSLGPFVGEVNRLCEKYHWSGINSSGIESSGTD
ncbi:thioredoxin family protein [Neptunomonas sp.]|uniref:thioredoxin family protein n=1 Tax=Neptunomonas sp. TaxID=1971898 RepID=UPI00356ABA5D